MKRNLILWLLAACVAVGAMAATDKGDFSRLDSLIAAQPGLVAAKEARLAQMKRDLNATMLSPRERYEAYKRLYEEYAAYQYDSAYACVRR